MSYDGEVRAWAGGVSKDTLTDICREKMVLTICLPIETNVYGSPGG